MAEIVYAGDVALIEHGGLCFSLCIPSRRRERRITRHPLLPWANVFVHETERTAYEREFRRSGIAPAALHTHTCANLSAIRNDMLARLWPAEALWQSQCDDDFMGLNYELSLEGRTMHREPAYILDVLVHASSIARAVPTGLALFAQSATPWENHRVHDPFVLRRWGSSSLWSLLDRDLRCDEQLDTMIDMDLCLQCIAKHGCLWMDCRWKSRVRESAGRTGGDPGGLAPFRSLANVRRTFRYMQVKWGQDVVGEGGKGAQRGSMLKTRLSIPMPEIRIS